MEPILIIAGTTFIAAAFAGAGAIQYAIREQKRSHRLDELSNQLYMMREKDELEARRLREKEEHERKMFVLMHNSFVKKQKISASSIGAILPLTGEVSGDMMIQTNPTTGMLEYRIDNRPHPVAPMPMIAPTIIPPAISETKATKPVLVYSGKDFDRISISQVD
jgi:hypothetical protein